MQELKSAIVTAWQQLSQAFLDRSGGKWQRRLSVLSFFNYTNRYKNGQTAFGVKYRYGRTGKDMSESFRKIRPGVFAGVRKNCPKSTRFWTFLKS